MQISKILKSCQTTLTIALHLSHELYQKKEKRIHCLFVPSNLKTPFFSVKDRLPWRFKLAAGQTYFYRSRTLKFYLSYLKHKQLIISPDEKPLQHHLSMPPTFNVPLKESARMPQFYHRIKFGSESKFSSLKIHFTLAATIWCGTRKLTKQPFPTNPLQNKNAL